MINNNVLTWILFKEDDETKCSNLHI